MEAAVSDDSDGSDDEVAREQKSAQKTSRADARTPTSQEANAGSGAESSQSDNLIKKRERSGSLGRTNPKRRRSDTGPPREYADLLNEEIRDAASHTCRPLLDSSYQGDTQYGAVKWTEFDRETFFDDSAKGGHWNKRSVPDLYPAKSPFEQRDYAMRLQQALVERELSAKRSTLFRPSEVPAAYETSAECEAALEDRATELANRVLVAEQAREEQRHGGYWLLDSQTAAQLESNLLPSDAFDDPKQSSPKSAEDHRPSEALLHAANILDLKAMLCLSNTFYIHGECIGHHGGSEAKSSVADNDISMFATAFTDLYALVQATTKRIVAASIFQANTRLRATDYGETKRRKLKVKTQDVLAAIHVLNLPLDSTQYWQGLARRLKSKVYTRPYVTGTRYRRWLDFEEVEGALGAPQACKNAEHQQPETASMDEYDESTASQADSKDQEVTAEESDDTMDQFVEAWDQKNSVADEQDLWAMLKTSGPTHPDVNTGARSPTEPSAERRSASELVGWQAHCNYQSAWETYGTHLQDLERSLVEGGARLQATERSGNSVHAALTQDNVNQSTSSPVGSATAESSTSDRDTENVAHEAGESSLGRGRSLRKRTPISYTAQAADPGLSIDAQTSDTDDDFQPSV